jgi:hypothetical protein
MNILVKCLYGIGIAALTLGLFLSPNGLLRADDGLGETPGLPADLCKNCKTDSTGCPQNNSSNDPCTANTFQCTPMGVDCDSTCTCQPKNTGDNTKCKCKN